MIHRRGGSDPGRLDTGRPCRVVLPNGHFISHRPYPLEHRCDCYSNSNSQALNFSVAQFSRTARWVVS
ncbi:MAG TPA: hypothetical protein VLM84_06515, partial [Chromatiaceae bacterium]|nr:hypothetical protein [Chromatiaceae bacterium]